MLGRCRAQAADDRRRPCTSAHQRGRPGAASSASSAASRSCIRNSLDILAEHPDCYFQIFTNGHFITEEKAQRLRELGNVTPLISIEGPEIVSDERRGRDGVYSKSMQGIQNCLKHKVLTGVCTSVCKTNLDDLVTEKWVDRLIEMGVFYTWFHIYRPMGPDASPELCLDKGEQRRVRQFVVDMRATKPIIFVDAYYDHAGEALCPAATGISHHINPWGGVEPCPIVQFVADSIHDESKSLKEKFNSPYLQGFRELARNTTRGCIVLERPDLLKSLVEDHSAVDGTARQSALAELAAMQVRPSQYTPDEAIPERSLAYRLAKWLFFNSFGVYDGRDHSKVSAPVLLRREHGELLRSAPPPALVELQTGPPTE
ncbi:MAG: radical SAM/SPASM domain-containing protein [Planctomycetaceae bacterium]